MTNVLKLKAKITEKGYTVETLALEIGFNKATLYRKLNRMKTFLIKEAYLIAIALDLTESELNEIFLASKSHKRNTLNKRSVIIYE